MKIGCDIEENSRFLNKDTKFYERIFTEKEIQYCNSAKNPHHHFCARFCAKEALIKALNDKTLNFKEIEITNGKNGNPTIHYKDISAEVSLSHCKNYSIATVLVF